MAEYSFPNSEKAFYSYASYAQQTCLAKLKTFFFKFKLVRKSAKRKILDYASRNHIY